MSVNYYLYINNIVGETDDQLHKGWIQIEGFNLSFNQLNDPAKGEKSSVFAANVAFSKGTSRVSPLLLTLITEGKVVPSVLVHGHIDGDSRDYLVWSYKQVVFKNILIGASGGDPSKESYTFEYQSVRHEYYPKMPDGINFSSPTITEYKKP